MNEQFETILEDGLQKLCKGAGLLGDDVMRCPDIDEKWEEYIKDYVADAVENFNDYSEAAIAWAAFLGMGVAFNWDRNWKKHRLDSYQSYYGSRGWDDMDEHILRDLLSLDLEGTEAKHISSVLDSCSLAVLGLLRHEGIEAQTADGFYALVRSYSVMFRIGAAMELYRLGYRKVPVGGES